MNIMRWVTASGAFLGLTSLIIGAAGDHMLAGKFTQDSAHIFDVALRYHQLYAILIFIMGIYGIKEPLGKTYISACLLFLTGILIFSGSLYASLWINLGPLALGTPLGGMMLMGGWILAGASFLKKPPFREQRHP